MAALLSAYTHVAMSRSSAAGFEGEGGEMLALLGGCIKVVDLIPAGVVKRILLRG